MEVVATLGEKVGAMVTKVGKAVVTSGRVGIGVIGGCVDGTLTGAEGRDLEGVNVGDTVVGFGVGRVAGCNIVGADEGWPDGILWLAVYTISLLTRVASS